MEIELCTGHQSSEKEFEEYAKKHPKKFEVNPLAL